MHEDIRTFTLEGEIDDRNLEETKVKLIHFMETMMRDQGSVPVLDMDPQYSQDYIPTKERFAFRLTLYGVYVGKDEAWQISGLMNGKMITKYIAKSK